MSTRVVIFGSGPMAEFLLLHKKTTTEIVGFLDSFAPTALDKDGNVKPVYNISDIGKMPGWDYIVISFNNVDKGLSALIKAGIEKDKIILYGDTGFDSRYKKQCVDMYEDEFKYNLIPDLFELPTPRIHFCNMNIPTSPIVTNDYVREQTLALCCDEICRKNVQGAVAELGVFQGDFSAKINAVFPQRTLYLYDTFEGFDDRDLKDAGELKSEKIDFFKNTSVNWVMEKMPNPEKIVIREGFFPDTFKEYDEQFALVSLDADLYAPILAGLQLFYPRLVRGGIY